MNEKRRSEYSEKLRDPRWQKKRLEILSRDGFTCVVCEDSTKTLHVHHKLYRYGKDPWDYQAADLETLCVDCHESQTEIDRDIKEKELEILTAFRGLSIGDFLMFPISSATTDDLAMLADILMFPGFKAIARAMVTHDYKTFQAEADEFLRGLEKK